MTDGVKIYGGTDFNQAVEVSTTDKILVNQGDTIRSAAVSQLPISTSGQIALAEVSARVTSVQTELTNTASVINDRITSVNTAFTNQTSVFNQSLSSVEQRINAVSAAARTRLVSLADVSLATGPATDTYTVSWDNTKNQFTLQPAGAVDLTSVNNAIASVDNRVTSVNTFFLNQTSITNDRVTSVYGELSTLATLVDGKIVSVDTRVTAVDSRVALVSANVTSVMTDLTSVKNVVSNNTSVNNAAHVSLESRINSVSVFSALISADLTSVKNVVSNNTSVNNAAHTSLQTQINVVSNNVSIVDARVTSVATRAGVRLQTFTSATGTATQFTGIPSGIREFTLMLDRISTNGTSDLLVQVGDTTFLTSTYGGSYNYPANTGFSSYSDGLRIGQTVAATEWSGFVKGVLTNASSNIWSFSYNIGQNNGLGLCIGGARVALSGALGRVRLTTVNGTDTLDNGALNLSWEFEQ